MSVDFRDAAERHWTDAWLLFGNNRVANSDHLIGMAAECALKAVMLDRSSFFSHKVERHQRGAETTMRILQEAILDGVVP